MRSGSMPGFHLQISAEIREGSEMLHVAEAARLKISKIILSIAMHLGITLNSNHYYVLAGLFSCLLGFFCVCAFCWVFFNCPS